MPAVSFMIGLAAPRLSCADAVHSAQYLGILKRGLAAPVVPKSGELKYCVRMDMASKEIAGQARQSVVAGVLEAGLRQQCLPLAGQRRFLPSGAGFARQLDEPPWRLC